MDVLHTRVRDLGLIERRWGYPENLVNLSSDIVAGASGDILSP